MLVCPILPNMTPYFNYKFYTSMLINNSFFPVSHIFYDITYQNSPQKCHKDYEVQIFVTVYSAYTRLSQRFTCQCSERCIDTFRAHPAFMNPPDN